MSFRFPDTAVSYRRPRRDSPLPVAAAGGWRGERRRRARRDLEDDAA